MARIMVLGNCVAHRLQFLLRDHPGFAERFELAPVPMIHATEPSRLEDLAREALACDVILTQPLFHFGPCSTEALRSALRPGQRLITFSAPHFEAYFPDVVLLSGKTENKFEPIFDWDSRIIFSCFVAGVSVFDVEALYLSHRMFRESAMRRAVACALETCAKRDQGVDVPVNGFIARHYEKERLFHTWMHPTDRLMGHMLAGLCEALDLPPADRSGDLEQSTFGFNRWPVLTRRHQFFDFEEQAHFVVAGVPHRIEDVAMAYYNFYEFHPHVVEQNRCKAQAG